MGKKTKPLIITNDRLMKEWDYERNRDLDPTKITLGSAKLAHWKCSKGHRWQAAIFKRGLDGQGCPYCAGRRASKTYNLAVKYPYLVKEWDYKKNTENPETFTPKSSRRAFWICPDCGASYSAAIVDRTNAKSGCPYCAGKKVREEDSLAAKYPNLLEHWYWERNDELGINPYQLGSGSHSKAWWRCATCHKPYIRAVLVQVNSKGACPYCTGRRRNRIISYYYI